MIRIHSIYNRMLHALLTAFVVCGIGTSCADEYFSDNKSSGGMATLKVQFPKMGSGDGRVTTLRFIAFQAGAAGTSGTLQLNALLVGNLADIGVSIPMGNSNIYIIGNPPVELDLGDVKTEVDLAAKIATWEMSKGEPHIMVESYRNVRIEKNAVKDSNGNVITLGQGLKRLISKLTVNLQYESLGGRNLVIDSVTIGNRAAYSMLLPCAFEGDSYVPSAKDRVTQLTETGTAGNTTTYQALNFYLSEYLVNAAHVGHSTCMHIYAHSQDNENERFAYPVYIGDWFGGSITYDDFKDAETPAKLVGVDGLSVTRNKHYTLNCTLKGAAQTGMQIQTDVEEWTVVDIHGDITMPYFNMSSTEVMVSPLKAQGTSVNYQASVPRDSISVVITHNPDNRFSYTISDQYINFIHSRLDVDSLTTATGLPIKGMAVVTVRDGNARLSKNIALGVFNPISRFYVRGTDMNHNYAATMPATVINNDWAMNWANASGYNNPYAGATTALHGQNPATTMMNNAIADSYSGCAAYWEEANNDRNKGRGLWRLPNNEGGSDSEAVRLMTLLQHLDATGLGFDNVAQNSPVWTSTENGATTAKVVQYGVASTTPNKTAANLVRCIRDLDNTLSDGGSSYLSVSHNVYEVAPIAYRTTIGTAPIYYESDGPVAIKLLDENGNDISNKGLGMPFIGFSADTEDILYAADEPSIAFPNNSYAKKEKGYFCLHSTLSEGYSENLTSLGDLKGPMPSELRKRKYTLLFTAGSLEKAVQIEVVNPLATKDVGFMSIVKGMGLSDQYAGYDYILKKRTTTGTDPRTMSIAMPVPDVTTGCAGYYENNSSDPKTGVGNWFVSSLIKHLGAIYAVNFNRWSSQLGNWFDGKNIDRIYGPGAGFIAVSGGLNANYWTTMYSLAYPDKHSYIIILSGSSTPMDKRSNPSAFVRCERRLNADVLNLSTQYVELAAGASKEILFYTNAISIANVTSEDVLHISGTNPAFTATTTTTTTTNTGRIVINCLDVAESGSEANLLVHTVGKSKRSETYKIIKLKVK